MIKYWVSYSDKKMCCFSIIMVGTFGSQSQFKGQQFNSLMYVSAKLF